MFLELKVYPNGKLVQDDKIHESRQSIKAIPTKTRLVFSKRSSLKRHVFSNARNHGWINEP